MSIIRANCSNCGTSFEYDYSKEKVFCTSCGARFINGPSGITLDNQYNGIARNLREEYTTQLYLFNLKERIKISYQSKKNLIIPLVLLLLAFIGGLLAFLFLPVMFAFLVCSFVGFLGSIFVVAALIKRNNIYKKQIQELNEYTRDTKEIKNLINDSIKNGTFGDKSVKASLEELIETRNKKLQSHLSQNDSKTIELIEKIPELKSRQYNTEEDVMTSVNNMSSLIKIAAKGNPEMINSYGFYLLTVDFCHAIEEISNRSSNKGLSIQLLELAKQHSSFILKANRVSTETRNHAKKMYTKYESDLQSLKSNS